MPDQFTVRVERQLIERLGPESSLWVEVVGFSRLPDFVFGRLGGRAGRHLTEGGARILLSGALSAVGSELVYYRGAAQRPGFVEELMNQLRELTANRATGERLLQTADKLTDTDLAAKLRDLALITAAYEAAGKQSVRGGEFALDAARELCEKDNIFSEYDIFLDHFKRFTPQEYEILEVMLASGTYVTVGITGECGRRCETELDLFYLPCKTAQRLKELAQCCGQGAAPDITEIVADVFSPDIAALEDRLFAAPEQPFEGRAENIRIVEARTEYEELEFIASEIRRLTKAQGYRWRDFAVITRRSRMASGLVEAVFGRFDIPVQIDTRAELSVFPLMTLILSAFDAVRGGYPYADMFRYLKTGLAGLSVRQTDALERYCYAWNIRGGAWRRPFSLHPDGYNARSTRRSTAMLRLLNRWRERAMAPLAEFEKAMGHGGGADISRAVYNLLIRLGVPEQLQNIEKKMPPAEAQLYGQVWDAVALLLDDMADMADPNVTPERYAELLKLAASQIKLGVIPATRDQVLVSEVERVIGASVKCAFVAGFTEGNFPAAAASSMLLTDGERRQLEAVNLPLSPVAAAAWPEERYLTYNALTAAADLLYITMPRTTLSGSAMRSSVFLPHLKALMPYNTALDAAAVLALEGPASSSQAVDMLLAGGAHQNYEGRPELNRAKVLKEAVFAAELKKPIANASRLYAGRGALSATSGERFAKCNFSYFCQYGLRLQPTKRNEFDAMQTGTFIHYVLERFFAKVPPEEGTNLTQEAAAKILDGIIETYIKEFLPDESERSARMQYLFSRLSRIVHSYMTILLDELKNSEFVPLDFELEVGRDIPALVYGDGENKIEVRGKIDRVDGLEKDGRLYLRIVDYKTGIKGLDYSELYQGVGLQMFLYLAAVLAGGRERYGTELVPAGVVYAPVRLDTVSLSDRAATDEDVRRQRMEKNKKNGLLIDDEEILRAMDHSGKFLTLPVAADKDGNIKRIGTSVASMERLGRLAEFAGRVLDEAAKKITTGSVVVNPLTKRGSKKPDACQFCDMQPVCRFEGEGRNMPYLAEEDFWRAIGGETVVHDTVYPGTAGGDRI